MMRAARPLAGPVPMNLAGTLPQFWTPYRFRGFGPRRWDGAYAGDEQPPGPPPSPGAAVNEIVASFRERGEGPALVLAARHGPAYTAGAKLYVSLAGLTEEELAQRAADLTAKVARTRALPTSPAAIGKLFVDARLYEVRQARANGATPPQAVKDRPVVATHGIPKWVTYGALFLSALGLGISVANSRGGR